MKIKHVDKEMSDEMGELLISTIKSIVCTIEITQKLVGSLFIDGTETINDSIDRSDLVDFLSDCLRIRANIIDSLDHDDDCEEDDDICPACKEKH